MMNSEISDMRQTMISGYAARARGAPAQPAQQRRAAREEVRAAAARARRPLTQRAIMRVRTRRARAHARNAAFYAMRVAMPHASRAAALPCFRPPARRLKIFIIIRHAQNMRNKEIKRRHAPARAQKERRAVPFSATPRKVFQRAQQRQRHIIARASAAAARARRHDAGASGTRRAQTAGGRQYKNILRAR